MSRSDTLTRVSFPFRRKPKELVAAVPATGDQANSETAENQRSAARTASKREQGIVTPKRTANRRSVEPPPANRREAYKRMREREKQESAERRKAMAAGDERFMLKRDKGPERAMVRDIVDHRLTVGTWFFMMSLMSMFVVMGGLTAAARAIVNLIWMLLGVATVIDSMIIARTIKKNWTSRFPAGQDKLWKLYYYGIARAITFRKLRMPRPRIRLGGDY